MGCYRKMKTVVLKVALVIAMMAIMLVEAQDVPSCAANLITCGDFLNATTKPPASCCDPLKDAVNNQLACLCNLYNSPDLLNTLRINVTQALRLPTLCGVSDNLCPGSKDNDSSSKNHAGKLASTGISGGLLVWASLMLF